MKVGFVGYFILFFINHIVVSDRFFSVLLNDIRSEFPYNVIEVQLQCLGIFINGFMRTFRCLSLSLLFIYNFFFVFV